MPKTYRLKKTRSNAVSNFHVILSCFFKSDLHSVVIIIPLKTEKKTVTNYKITESGHPFNPSVYNVSSLLYDFALGALRARGTRNGRLMGRHIFSIHFALSTTFSILLFAVTFS